MFLIENSKINRCINIAMLGFRSVKKIHIIVGMCVFLILVSYITTGSIYRSERIDIEKNGRYKVALADIKKGENIIFKLDTNKTVNLYIINESEYAYRHIYGFNKSEVIQKGIKDISFNWTVPDKDEYMMIVENPHNSSIGMDYIFHTEGYTIDLTETEIYNDLMCCCCGSIGVLVILLIVIVSYIKIK